MPENETENAISGKLKKGLKIYKSDIYEVAAPISRKGRMSRITPSLFMYVSKSPHNKEKNVTKAQMLRHASAALFTESEKLYFCPKSKSNSLEKFEFIPKTAPDKTAEQDVMKKSAIPRRMLLSIPPPIAQIIYPGLALLEIPISRSHSLLDIFPFSYSVSESFAPVGNPDRMPQTKTERAAPLILKILSNPRLKKATFSNLTNLIKRSVVTKNGKTEGIMLLTQISKPLVTNLDISSERKRAAARSDALIISELTKASKPIPLFFDLILLCAVIF